MVPEGTVEDVMSSQTNKNNNFIVKNEKSKTKETGGITRSRF